MRATTTLAPQEPPLLLKLLANGERWKMVRALAGTDLKVSELVTRTGEAPNLVSYHLRRLGALRLVRSRRSAADRRDVYYTLDVRRLGELFRAAGETLHPGVHPRTGAGESAAPQANAGKRPRVLFLCTHNSARSQMAEGLLRQLAGGGVDVISAGSEPSRVHPLAIRAMADVGVDIRGQRSKHVDELRGQRFDYVITVCDRARESCPVFPGEPARIHWSIADPSTVQGTDEKRQRAFDGAARELRARIGYLLTLMRRADRPPGSSVA